MVTLSSIYGIGKTSLELLEVAGFRDVEAIAGADVDELLGELTRANSIFKISKRNPSRSAVAKWIQTARDVIADADAPKDKHGESGESLTDEAPAEPELIDHERDPEVVRMIAAAPVALPLPVRLLVENQLGVSEVSAGILLNRFPGELDLKVDPRVPRIRPQPKPVASAAGYVRLADNASQRLEIDTSKIRSTDDLGDQMLKMPAVKVSPANDRVALLRAPRSSTNEGRNPESRWYIRGVLHSHPVSIAVGAVMTILVMVLLPLSVVSAALLFLSRELPEAFGWVPEWLLAFPLALPLAGIAYLIWGVSGSCRICGQKLFVHRSHLKNSRAHRLRGLGYILPLCFHLLVFRWFRCTHCGTPVRLKE